MHKYPQNQSCVGPSGQTLTTNVCMTLGDWQNLSPLTGLTGLHLCRINLGTPPPLYKLRQSPKLIRSLRLL